MFNLVLFPRPPATEVPLLLWRRLPVWWRGGGRCQSSTAEGWNYVWLFLLYRTLQVQSHVNKYNSLSRVPRPSPRPPSPRHCAPTTQPTGAWRPASSSPRRWVSPGPNTPKRRRRRWAWANTVGRSSPPCLTACRWVQALRDVPLLFMTLLPTLWISPHLSRIPDLARSCGVPSSRAWPTGSTRRCRGSPSSPGSTQRGVSQGRAAPGLTSQPCSRASWRNGEWDSALHTSLIQNHITYLNHITSSSACALHILKGLSVCHRSTVSWRPNSAPTSTSAPTRSAFIATLSTHCQPQRACSHWIASVYSRSHWTRVPFLPHKSLYII